MLGSTSKPLAPFRSQVVIATRFAVALTSEDLREIDEAASKIKVQGARLPPAVLAMSGRWRAASDQMKASDAMFSSSARTASLRGTRRGSFSRRPAPPSRSICGARAGFAPKRTARFAVSR